MEINQERLEREYNLDLITTAPSVITRSPDRRCRIDGGQSLELPRSGSDRDCGGTFVSAAIMCPTEFVGNIMVCARQARRVKDMKYLEETRCGTALRLAAE
jgi:GTP-binding protein LepA